MRRLPVKAVVDLAPGTLVLLPEEIGGHSSAGYAKGDGSSMVLLPGYQSLHAVELPAPALVKVIANPRELANAYLRGRLGRLDRRWRPGSRSETRGKTSEGPKAEDDVDEDRAGASPDTGAAA